MKSLISYIAILIVLLIATLTFSMKLLSVLAGGARRLAPDSAVDVRVTVLQ